MYAISLIENITAFRNPNGSEHKWARLAHRVPANPSKVALAEVGYILVIPFAIVEMAFSAVAALFLSTYYCLTDNQPCLRMVIWPLTSAFAVGWAVVNALINPFCNDMIQNRENALATVFSGNIFQVNFASYMGVPRVAR